MKKFIFLILFLLSSPAMAGQTCATGYTRTALNYCELSAYPTLTSFTDAACSNLSIPAGSNAVNVVLATDVTAISANGIANRTASISVFSDATCTTLVDLRGFSVREFNATAAGTAIGDSLLRILAPVVAGKIYFKSAGSNAVGFPSAAIVGYFD